MCLHPGPAHPQDGCGKTGLAVQNGKQDAHRSAGRDGVFLREFQHHATAGDVRRHTFKDGAVGFLHARRHLHRDPNGLPPLLALPRYAARHPQNERVEDGPEHVHHDRSGVGAIPHICRNVQQPRNRRQACWRPRKLQVPRNRAQKTHAVEYQHDEEWQSDAVVEEAPAHHPALGRDVERSQLGIKQSHGGRQKNVWRQHRLVNLVPEGMPVLPLDPRVRHGRQHQVRKCIRQNGGPIARNIGVAPDQVNQWRK